MKPAEKFSPPAWEIVAIMVLCFGWAMFASILSLVLGGGSDGGEGAFSNARLLELVLFELFVGGLSLLLLRQRGYAMSALLPAPHWLGLAAGGLIYLVNIVADGAAAQMFGPNQPAQPIEYMMATSHPSLTMVLLLAVVNGTYEEVFVLGYLVRALGKYGGSFAVGVSTSIRLCYHAYQGPMGAMYVVIFGIVQGAYYWRTRDLWSCVVAHMFGDIVPFL